MALERLLAAGSIKTLSLRSRSILSFGTPWKVFTLSSSNPWDFASNLARRGPSGTPGFTWASVRKHYCTITRSPRVHHIGLPTTATAAGKKKAQIATSHLMAFGGISQRTINY
jgi:hypothetical protein